MIKILITVNGGLADVVGCPKGIEVEIRDFDTINADPDDDTKDFTEEEIRESENSLRQYELTILNK